MSFDQSMPLLSVIIPVYNVKPFLKQCVESVIYQNYKNIEVIIVDDGSTDGSAELCDELSQIDSRIVVFHKDNGGLSSARNFGLDESHGEWIAFVDSDDWVDKDIYTTLIRLAVKNSTQIASCSFYKNINSEDFAVSVSEFERIYELREIVSGLLTQKEIRFEVWNKIWRRDLIGSTRFVEGQVSEDIHWDRILFTESKRIIYTNRPLYHYRIRRPGNTRSSFKIGRLCVFEEFDAWANDLYNLGMEYEANIILSIAMKFAVIIYEEAYRHKQDAVLLNSLNEKFKHYYGLSKKYSSDKISIFLFKFSPKLYCEVIKHRRSNSK